MGLQLFGKRETPKSEMLSEIEQINARLGEIQRDMNEENQAQYTEEITALMQCQLEIMNRHFPDRKP